MKKTIGKIALIVALLMLVTVCLTSCGSNEKKDTATEVKDAVTEKTEEVKDAATDAAAAVEEKAEEAKDAATEAVEEVKDAATDAAAAVEEKAEEAKDAAADAVEEVKDAATDAAAAVEEKAEEVKDAAADAVEEVKDAAADTAAAVEEKAEEVKDAAAEAVAELAVMSHADYDAASADNQDPVYVETYVQATQSWYEGKITIYAQSPDGAYFIYNAACSEEDAAKLVPGTKIAVKGNKSAWSGEVEIVDATIEILEGDSFIAEAFDATELLAKEDELIAHQNEKVSFKGLTVAAQDDGAAFNYKNAENKTDDLYVRFTKDEGTYNFCVEFYLCGNDTEVYKAVEGLQVGDVVDVEGFLYWYNGANVHMTKVTKAE